LCYRRVSNENNVVDAACKGAQFGLHLIGAIIANIIAFVSFVAFINAIICWLGSLVGIKNLSFEVSDFIRKNSSIINRYRIHLSLTNFPSQVILGKILIPVTWILGVDYSECETVGRLIGLKMTINEFVAYRQMGKWKNENKLNVCIESLLLILNRNNICMNSFPLVIKTIYRLLYYWGPFIQILYQFVYRNR
jgi:pyrimidine nucleoside transport protein